MIKITRSFFLILISAAFLLFQNTEMLGNSAPVADAGEDQTVVDSDGDGYETVMLDGSGSYDPSGNIVSYYWFWGGAVIGSGEKISFRFSVGTHTVTLGVTDNSGNTSYDAVQITVTADGGGNDDPGTGNLDISSISPDSGLRGTLVYVTVSGSGFDTGTGISLKNGSGKTPVVSSVSYINSEEMTAIISIPKGGPKKDVSWDVQVTKSDGSTDVLFNGFTVK